MTTTDRQEPTRNELHVPPIRHAVGPRLKWWRPLSRRQYDRFTVALVLLAGWFAASATADDYLVPRPVATFERVFDDVARGETLEHALVTVFEAIAGFVLGGVPAVVLPLMLRRNPTLIRTVDVFMLAGHGMPKLALTPLFIVWLGVGVASKIALVGVSVFFIVYFSVLKGLQSLDVRLIQTLRILGADETRLLWHVAVPGTLPHLIAGLRMALPYSIGGAVVAELVSSNRGLGYLVQLSATNFDTTGVFAALFVIALLTATGNLALTLLEARLLSWRPTWSQRVEVNDHGYSAAA